MGLINEEQHNRLLKKKEDINNLINELKTIHIKPKELTKEVQDKIGNINKGESLYDLLKRPEIRINDLISYLNNNYNKDVLNTVEISIKYEGYIAKTNREIERMLKLEEKKIPNDIDYSKVINLASEARQKLEKVRPLTIAQASRISGVNPADIAVLSVYLKKEYGK